MTVLSQPIRFGNLLDRFIVHYFNDKQCFLMLTSAHKMRRQNKIHPMSRKSVGTVSYKNGDLISNTNISRKNKEVKKV